MDSKVKEYREWLEAPRVGLPPLPRDYVDSQIEAVELYLKWIEGPKGMTTPSQKVTSKLQKVLDTELQKVVEIGEDGAMIVDGRLTLKEARQRMYDFWVECNGKEDADDFFENWCHEDSIGTAWLHLTTKEQKEKWDDADWYVSAKEQSPYEVWAYWG